MVSCTALLTGKKKKQICVFQSGPNKMTHFEKKKNKPAFYFFLKQANIEALSH